MMGILVGDLCGWDNVVRWYGNDRWMTDGFVVCISRMLNTEEGGGQDAISMDSKVTRDEGLNVWYENLLSFIIPNPSYIYTCIYIYPSQNQKLTWSSSHARQNLGANQAQKPSGISILNIHQKTKSGDKIPLNRAPLINKISEIEEDSYGI